MNRKVFFTVTGVLAGLIYWFIGALIATVVETPWDWVVFMTICAGLGLCLEGITRTTPEGEKGLSRRVLVSFRFTDITPEGEKEGEA